MQYRTLVFRVGSGDGVERAPFITSSYTDRTPVLSDADGAGDVVERALFAAAFTTPNKSENDLNCSMHISNFSTWAFRSFPKYP